MKRVALYARVSTAGQDANPQLAYLRDWSARQGFVVAGEFIEVVSGRMHRRPQMDKVMALVRGHHVHAVAVRKLDRWGRSLMNLKTTVEEMVEASVTFYAVESGIAYEKHTPTGKLFLAQLAAFAEFEADLISERTKDSLAAKVAQGMKLGRPLVPCHDCGATRVGPKRIRGKRAGILVPLCEACKRGDRNGDAAGSPAEPSILGDSANGRLRMPVGGQDGAPMATVVGSERVVVRGEGVADGHDGGPVEGLAGGRAAAAVAAPDAGAASAVREGLGAVRAARADPKVGHGQAEGAPGLEARVAKGGGFATGGGLA